MATRVFHFSDGKSDKFWEIELDGCDFTVRFGRTGTAGQTQTKSFPSEAKARAEHDKLIGQKTKKGYVEGAAGASLPAAKPAAPKPAAPKPAAATASSESDPPSAAASEPAAATAAPPDAVEAVEPLVRPGAALPAWADGLSRSERYFAAWRPVEPPGAPEPFDRARALRQLAGLPTSYSGWHWHWEAVDWPEVMDRQEARFWLAAMDRPRVTTPKQRAKALEDADEGPLTLSQTLKLISEQTGHQTEPALAKMVVAFHDPVEILDHLLDAPTGTQRGTFRGQDARFALVSGLRPHLVPRLEPAQLDRARAVLAPRIQADPWPSDAYSVPPLPVLTAAGLGLSELVAPVLAGIEDGFFRSVDFIDHYHRPQSLILALGSPEAVRSELERLGRRLIRPWHITAWLAIHGLSALDVVRDSIVAVTNREEAEHLIAPLVRADAPELAETMLELVLHSKAAGAARSWLLDHPAATLIGLAPLAGRRTRAGELARELLGMIERRSEPALVESCLAAMPDAARAAFLAATRDNPDQQLELMSVPPAWLASGLAAAPKRSKKRPDWASAADLPPLVVEGRRLTDDQVDAVIDTLLATGLDVPQPLLEGLRAHGDAGRNDRFAWRLFETWLGAGADSKHKWAMLAIGHLGGDDCALALAPLVRAWPGESQHARAVLGLECLEGIGSDTALMQIDGVARTAKFKGLKQRAQEAMEKIARKLGLERAELEDRIVPDCGLDARGERVFDFGPRQFHFVMGPDLKPMVRDAAGKKKTALPKANSKDDDALAEAATAEWKRLTKQLKEIAKSQAARLEQAMVTGRRWSGRDLERFLVHHPLMSHLVRPLLWGGWAEGEARPRLVFRITEERDYADVEDEPIELDAALRYGIVHPMQLDEDARAAWGQVLSDYELVPAFAQLGRPVHGLEPGERDAVEITRYAAVKVGPGAFVGTLERLGWIRGMAEDGGVYHEHSKPFPAAGVTAIVEYYGVPMGYIEGWDEQSIDRCYFVHGHYRPEVYARHDERAKLGEVDPIAVSEVLADLAVVASKGR